MSERRYSTEARQTLFWALLAARCAGEPHVTSGRIASAALRSGSAAAYCEAAQLPLAELVAAADEPGVLASEECRRTVEHAIAQAGLEVGSSEHLMTIRPLPIEAAAQRVINALSAVPGERTITPLELLLALIRADASLRARVANHGLDEDALRRKVEE
jgi:hypothetical protein